MNQRKGDCDQCHAVDVVIAKKLPSSGAWCVKCNAKRLDKSIKGKKRPIAPDKDSMKLLIKECDRVFSLYIRQRDTDENGYGKCVTCPRVIHWSEGDCGHWIPRGFFAVRYREQNAALQCRVCNRHESGCSDVFSEYVRKTYGLNMARELIALKSASFKIDRDVLQELIKKYST